jgi:hypothetical protein
MALIVLRNLTRLASQRRDSCGRKLSLFLKLSLLG